MSRRRKRQATESADSTRPRWPLVGLAGGAVLAGVFLLIQRPWAREASSPAPPPPVVVHDPPTIDTQGVDPEIIEAVDRDRRAVLERPGSGLAWGTLGMTLRAHEFDEQASECFAQAAALERQDPRWPYLHAQSILRTDPQSALPLLRRAVELAGNTPPAVRLTLCETLLELFQLDEAEKELNSLLVDHSGDARARLAKARLALMRDDYQNCVQQLQDLITYLQTRRAYPGRQQPILLLLAEALRRQGDVDQAERIRQQAMAQSNPSWDDPYQKQVNDRKVGLKTYLVKADLTYGQGKYDESIAVLQQAIEKYPDSIWAKILLARALIRTGAPDSKRPDGSIRLRRAETVLGEVLQAEPNSVEAIFRLAVAKLYQNKPEESAALYERATALKPDFTMAHFNLAHCRMRLNDRAGAIAAAEASVAAEPSFVQGHTLAGTLLMDEGRYAEAEKHFDAAVQLQPNNPQLRQQLGEARRRMQP